MRDDDKLRLLRKFAHDCIELIDVGVVKRGIYFVENAEWGGLEEIKGKEQCRGCKCFFASGQLIDTQWFLPFGLGDDLDAGFQRVRGIVQP